MPLTDVQIAEETAWANNFIKALETSPEESIAYYSDDATVARSGLPPMKGKSAILKLFQFSDQAFESYKFGNIDVTVDEANGRVIITTDGSGVMSADPEKQVLEARWAFVLEKALGKEAKITKEEGLHDPSPAFNRIAELGINPADMLASLLS